MSIYFTSDLHLSHEKVAGHRGYSDVDEHDEAIKAEINKLPFDSQLWILGDITIGRRVDETRWVRKLGKLTHKRRITMHLIPGNHDSCHPMHRDSYKRQRFFMDHFASVQPFARRRINGHSVLLSHFPYRGDHTHEDRATQYRLRDEGLWLLHGHTHSVDRGPAIQTISNWGGGTTVNRPLHKQIHVGWDAWQRPAHIDEIADIIEGRDHQ